MIGTVAIQHNTWTVNSITHMWGWTKGLSSSAKNNYVWLGPVGEGNHHGDHHDFPRDYRNGFGWTGWLLDPSRYPILVMRALGLLGELNKASAKEEAAVLGSRRMDAILPNKDQLSADAQALYTQLEEKVLELRKDWVDAIGKWESLKKQNRFVQKASLSRQEISEEIRQAKAHVNAKKEEFFSALDSLRRQALALA
jgi:stearoyl-CoA desaturase (delta-9 desaturase)